MSKPSTEESIHGNKPCSTDSAEELVALDVHILQSLDDNDKYGVDLDEEEDIEEIMAEDVPDDQQEEEEEEEVTNEEAENISEDHVSFSDEDILKFNPGW